MIHLDTSFLIRSLVPGSGPEAQLVGWLSAGEKLAISSIAWVEFLCGPLSADAEILARRVFPHAAAFEREDAEMAANLFNRTGRRSRSFADCCIAAVAIRAQAPLATSNQADFAGLVSFGLMLV